jgi:hypothetical protein
MEAGMEVRLLGGVLESKNASQAKAFGFPSVYLTWKQGWSFDSLQGCWKAKQRRKSKSLRLLGCSNLQKITVFQISSWFGINVGSKLEATVLMDSQ